MPVQMQAQLLFRCQLRRTQIAFEFRIVLMSDPDVLQQTLPTPIVLRAIQFDACKHIARLAVTGRVDLVAGRFDERSATFGANDGMGLASMDDQTRPFVVHFRALVAAVAPLVLVADQVETQLLHVHESGWAVFAWVRHLSGVLRMVSLQLILPGERLVALVAFVLSGVEMFGSHVALHRRAIREGHAAAGILTGKLIMKI